MEHGKTMPVRGIERPQVCLNEKGELIALLASIYPKVEGPTYIIVRPVRKFVPKNK
jgi:hypothetical protein